MIYVRQRSQFKNKWVRTPQTNLAPHELIIPQLRRFRRGVKGWAWAVGWHPWDLANKNWEYSGHIAWELVYNGDTCMWATMWYLVCPRLEGCPNSWQFSEGKVKNEILAVPILGPTLLTFRKTHGCWKSRGGVCWSMHYALVGVHYWCLPHCR
jgi:hypothetical protein